MIITLLCYLPSAASLALVGLAILMKNQRNRINVAFFCVAVVIALWLTGLCISYLHLNYAISLWALRLAVGIGTFIAPALLYFSVFFPVQLGKIPRAFHFLILLPAIILFILSLTPLLIPMIAYRQYTVAIRGAGALYTLQSLYEVVGVVAAFGLLLSKVRRVAPRERVQIILVVAGLIIAAAANVVANFVLVLLHAATYFSDLAAGLSLVAFVGATAYAIVRHHLFDMRLAITRAVGFTLTIGLVSLLYTILVLGIGAPLVTKGDVTLTKNQQLPLLLLPFMLLAALTFHSLERFIAQKSRRLFYQDSYDTREALDRFSDALISESDLEKMVAKALLVLQEAIKPTHALFVTTHAQGHIYQQLVARKEPRHPAQLMEEVRHLGVALVVKDDVPTGQWQQLFEEEDISLVLRLGSPKEEMIGALLLGPKQNGRIYSRQDVGLLTVSAKNFGVAIENAKKYEQIATFADTMRAEVLKATTNLRRANKKLRILDALKDDFISMASHQLRSPATSVRDAIKMLEQNYLTPTERRKIIQLADASSERLVGVITDMLSVARIQAGHFTLEKTEVEMGQLVERAILQASALANERQVRLVFERPKHAITLLADRAKLNEIMANYIENAIRYSYEKTTVIVTLQQENGQVRFTVSDQGIGVPEGERKDLFNKFYRAANARKAQPNGNGIGLFVVKTVATAHGGDVYYKPLNPGSCFGFWIPTGGQ